MIINTTVDKLDELLDFSWDIQSHLEHASYPMWESKDELREAMIARYGHKDDRVLAYYDGDALLGVLMLFVEMENAYLQASGVYAKTDVHRVFKEIMEYLKGHYSGFEFLIGVPAENTSWINVLTDAGAEITDASTVTHITPV